MSRVAKLLRRLRASWLSSDAGGGIALWGVTALLTVGTSCTLAPATEGPTTGPPGALPSGFGTLRQEQVSMSLTSGELRLMVTPLDPSVTRVTAPDTERRLDGMAAAHAPIGAEPSALFLVSFFSEQPDVRFIPEEVQLVSRGVRVRPETIRPVTPTWGQRRVQQRQTEMAVYEFGGQVDLESELTLMYGLEQTSEWSGILVRIQAERARVRARGDA